MQPMVSVIIPVYNAQHFVTQSIHSVLNQSFRDLELIVIDDGSTDDSASVIEGISDPRMRFYKKKNEGQCKTLNFGLRESKGRFIKFLDADDYLNDVHLEKMLMNVSSVTTDIADTLFLSKWQRFSGTNHFWFLGNRPEWIDCTPRDFIELALGNGPDMLPAWQWLIPRTILNKAGFWNEQLGLGNDFEFSIRLLLASQSVKLCEDAIVFYRSNLTKNMSSDTSLTTILSVLQAARLGISNILSLYDENIIRRACANKLQVWLVSYYPFIHKNLVTDVEAEIEELGGSQDNIRWGAKMLIFNNLIGWKKARMLQYYFYKIRYSL